MTCRNIVYNQCVVVSNGLRVALTDVQYLPCLCEPVFVDVHKYQTTTRLLLRVVLLYVSLVSGLHVTSRLLRILSPVYHRSVCVFPLFVQRQQSALFFRFSISGCYPKPREGRGTFGNTHLAEPRSRRRSFGPTLYRGFATLLKCYLLPPQQHPRIDYPPVKGTSVPASSRLG